MGVSIHPETGLVSEVLEYIFQYQLKSATTNKFDEFDQAVDFISDVLGAFGVVTDDGKWFILQYNEYYEDYNPSCEIVEFLSRYFGFDPWEDKNWFDLPLSPNYGKGGASADDVAYKMKIELPEVDDEDDTW